MSRKTYRQELTQLRKTMERDFLMLKSDPHFQSVLKLLEEQRLRFYRDAAGYGISQKDQDKFLGAAGALDEIYSILTQKNSNGDAHDTGG